MAQARAGGPRPITLTPLAVGLEPPDRPALAVKVQVVGLLVVRLDLHEQRTLVPARPLVLGEQGVRNHDLESRALRLR